jgi:hypothetical protein
MYNAQAYFDNNGIFIFEPVPDYLDPNLNVSLDVDDFNDLIISETMQQNSSNIHNIIQIFGLTFESNGSFNLND